MDSRLIPISEHNEQVIQKYFADLGWRAEKLKSGADFRVCCSNNCFLCEVKTIESVRANYPYTSEYHFSEERRKHREEIEQWQEENPSGRLLMLPGQYEFLFGDETEFLMVLKGGDV